MLKGYIRASQIRRRPEKPLTDYSFDHRSEEGIRFETRQEAEASCVIFNGHRIEIPSSEGGKHICENFQVEERADGKFVVFCLGPFIQDKTISSE